MKHYLTLITLLLITTTTLPQSVGIGTTTPSANAILDITSTNKGLLLPRVSDTTTIAKPTAGLVIYNQTTSSPSFFNGTQWQTLGVSPLSMISADSMTYSIAGAAELGIKTIYQSTATPAPTTTGGSGGSVAKPVVSDLSFSKSFDINTIPLKKNAFNGAHSSNIEFKFYKSGSTTPFYSIKLYDVLTLSYSDIRTNPADGNVETYTLHFSKIGFKDWVNTQSILYDVTANTTTSGSY